jgi:phage host-nuclease inhibitor protein Gam
VRWRGKEEASAGTSLQISWDSKIDATTGGEKKKKRDVTTGAVSWSRGEPGYYIQEPSFV